MSRRQLIRPGVGHLADRLADGSRYDDSGSTVLHADMDAFFAAVEVRRRPELRGRPVIVGGAAGRGVVLSATYEARRFGVHSAMSMARALRLCPRAVVVPPDHQAYSEVSAGVMDVLRSITPEVEPLAADEAFLDVGGAVRRLGPPTAIGQLVRDRVRRELGVVISVGGAATKFVAKVASTLSKPDGLLVVPADRTLDFLHPLPVAALWGVGERTEEVLRRIGLRTVGDVARAPLDTLERALGHASGQHLAALAAGRDDRVVVREVVERSTGADETFPYDVDDRDVIHRELLRLSARCASRLRRGGRCGATVTLKVRFADFRTITRASTLDRPTDVTREIFTTVRDLYDRLGLRDAPLRLVGVRVSGLRATTVAPRQLVLGERDPGWREADLAVDAAVRRFGRGALRPASLVGDRWERTGPSDGRTPPPAAARNAAPSAARPYDDSRPDPAPSV